ncbi:acyl-CoA thioesterase [Streptomyces sp. NPDC057580]|uniref:acyl-CoA thioesterase n=1 Tax=Streptomyces sp. NPDC057580 TaxID=3346173 RepID=UPI0036B701CA
MSTPAARPAEPLHTLTFRLGYADTDPAGILYYGAWFPWMERMQSEWFYLNGLRQDQLADKYGFWSVTCRTECEYLVPVGLFDEIRAELRVGRIGRRSFDMRHDLRRTADEVLVGRAGITIVTVTPEGKSTAIPDVLRRHLEAWQNGTVPTPVG